MEVAEQYPTAVVKAMDLSPIHRDNVPANCEYILGDLTKGLPFADGSMDLVQSRHVF